MPPAVASLDVTEVGGDTGRTLEDATIVKGGTGEADLPADQGRIALDVRVRIPNRMFLRGRGLDTEWQGDLAVSGTASAPMIDGELTAVRGRIDALSKTFRLAGGEVAFDGGAAIDPQVDVEAVHEGDDITVTVRVSGPASKPEIALSSQPMLPQDEILSRMLFGKQVTDLTGAQAAQLAAAVAELSGATGSGPGFMEKIRRGLGVDVLQFGGETGTSVRAGQYLSDDVFLGVEQGLGAESSQVTLEVGITDNIAVESNVGATGNSNVGIQFKWDY
jgi:translocation and assembly module TamB